MSPVRYLVRIVAASLMLVLAACGAGSGEGVDQNGQPLPTAGGGQTPLAPTLASIQDNVFTPICTACHTGAGAPQGLQLDAAEVSASKLINVPVPRDPSQVRVKPFDPDNSFLIRKLEYPQGTIGARMPLNQPPLDPSTIAVIRQWITSGAPQQ
jgi:hypothetical protein